MTYTREEKETCYYLSKLLPYLETTEDFEDGLLRLERFLFPKKLKRSGEKAKREQIKNLIARQSKAYLKEPPTYLHENVAHFARMLCLSEPEEKIVRFLVDVDNNSTLKRSLCRFSHDLAEKDKTLAAVAGLNNAQASVLLHFEAPLLRFGVLERHYSGDYSLKKWAERFLSIMYKDEEHRRCALLGTPLGTDSVLTRKDFSYVDAVEFVLKLMKKARETKGFNILLYGTPGTGKTSFARFLAKSAKLKLYPVGIAGEANDERNYRLQEYFRKQMILKNERDACLLFDEGEDMFSSMETRTSKVEINNFLENNKVPVLWTTNKIHRMDPAFIRRFTLAICFKHPPVEVREKIWKKYLSKYKIFCPKTDLLTLVKTNDVPPSMIAGAAHAAELAGGNLETVKTHLSLMKQALAGGIKKTETPQRAENFNPALIHADMDLSTLTEQIKSLGRLNFSLCLYGASGTGKSAYARYLAEQLGLEVQHKRASDLISPYVGETEQNIARAFAQAKATQALLIFDEADTFLRDRNLALRSWEVSSVNEMLTWMESHPYPFICTTNLMDTLDAASLRRFSFKVKYDFLTKKQVCEAFKHFFGLSVRESEIAALNKLTPGDFSLVKNKAEFLGKSAQLDALKEMLETEQKLKHTVSSGGIGFRL